MYICIIVIFWNIDQNMDVVVDVVVDVLMLTNRTGYEMYEFVF